MTYIKNITVTIFIGAQLFMYSGCSNNAFQIERHDLLKGMNLVISDSAFSKIKQKRKEALEKKLLIKTKDDYVPGIVKSNNKTIHVKARLKGDHPDHFEGNRWSFRIVGRDGEILNHKKISVQGVHTRAYLIEWIYHQLLKNEDLINLQYEFFPFCVNDSLCGIYAFESHFDNFLLDNANREYGPILKFDETDFWNYSTYPGVENRDKVLMENAKILLMNKKWGRKKENVSMCEKAKTMLDDFRNQKRPSQDVFDLEIWAKFIAVNELVGGDHALRWHNLRFYFNPTTEKIEPIGFDCESWMAKTKPLFSNTINVETFHQLMLNDQHYKNLIKKELLRLSAKEYMNDFFAKHQDEIDKMELLLKKEKPNYTFWESSFYQSQERILRLLDQN